MFKRSVAIHTHKAKSDESGIGAGKGRTQRRTYNKRERANERACSFVLNKRSF